MASLLSTIGVCFSCQVLFCFLASLRSFVPIHASDHIALVGIAFGFIPATTFAKNFVVLSLARFARNVFQIPTLRIALNLVQTQPFTRRLERRLCVFLWFLLHKISSL